MTTNLLSVIEQLVPCPFCGAGSTEIKENGKMWTGMKYSDPVSVSVQHWCEPINGQPSRMIERIGRDTEAAIAAWNQRPALAAAQQALEQPQGEVPPSYRADYPTSADEIGAENEKAKADERLYGVGFSVNGWHVPAAKVACWGMSKSTHPQATEPAPSCTRCGATTGQACNDMGCGYLEAGNGEPAPSTEGERAKAARVGAKV